MRRSIRLCVAVALAACVICGSSRESGAQEAAPAAVLAAPPPVETTADGVDYALTAQGLTNVCYAVVGTTRDRVEAILRRPVASASFANVVLALENVAADANDQLVAEEFLGSVSGEREVRDASDRCQDAVSALFAGVDTRPELAARLEAVAARPGPLDRADAKLLELWLTLARRSGADLPDAERAQVRALLHRIDELQTAFAANLSSESPAIALTPAQTAGLPADFLAGLARTEGGGYVVPVSESTDQRFLADASDASARRRYYEAYGNRGYPANLPILREALAARLRLARLLGASTWADYVLADRMAKSPGRVRSFLDDLDARLLPAARGEIARLARLKAQETGRATARIEPWDVAYYHAMLMRRAYRVDEDRVRRYFPARHTIDAVLGVYARLLGVSFARVEPTRAWNPDVERYAVSDAGGGRFLGTLYLDLYPRPGKYTHFASFPLLPERRRPDGSIRPPIDAVVGNWARSAPGRPALLSRDEVQTFFHELGHAMAALLATTPYETLSAGFRTDFVEAPSQMLENWIWDPGILKALSRDVDTGQPLPDALIRDVVAARYVDEAYFTTRQILYADVDLAYHSGRPGDDVTATWREIAERVSPTPFVAGTHPEAAFGHIMGGYDAGYYGYLWSKVYAQDLFTAFAAAGLEDPTVGARYRNAILAPAREVEPDDEVRAFLGRPVSAAAFYDALRLSPPTP